MLFDTFSRPSYSYSMSQMTYTVTSTPLPLPWLLASSSRGTMMVELRWLEGERTAVVYISGSDCTTTGMRCTCLASLLGLEGGTG